MAFLGGGDGDGDGEDVALSSMSTLPRTGNLLFLDTSCSSSEAEGVGVSDPSSYLERAARAAGLAFFPLRLRAECPPAADLVASRRVEGREPASASLMSEAALS